jgi:hypothetical protein
MKRKSGQAVFEFIIAAVLFFAVIFYIINYLDTSVTNYSAGSQFNLLEAKTAEISEYLVYVNLTEEWPLLSYTNIADLDWACNDDYSGLLKRFDLGERKFKLQVNEGPKLLLDCERTRVVPDKERAEIERFALSENNTILSVRVVVW